MNEETGIPPALEPLTPVPLPPRPDRKTGKPFPPHAPLYEPAEPDRSQGTTPPTKFLPPPEHGPVLAWNKSRPYKALLYWVPVLIVLYIARGLLTNWSAFWWTTVPFAVVIVYSLAAYFAFTRQYAAGAEWVATKTKWVLTYELKSVKAYAAQTGGPNLQLADGDGRELEIAFSALHQNQRLCDLVYNGILHSVVASGAKTNDLAEELLKLPSR